MQLQVRSCCILLWQHSQYSSVTLLLTMTGCKYETIKTTIEFASFDNFLVIKLIMFFFWFFFLSTKKLHSKKKIYIYTFDFAYTSNNLQHIQKNHTRQFNNNHHNYNNNNLSTANNFSSLLNEQL